MAGSENKAGELLKRPLYVYDLPKELLESLTTKHDAQAPATITNLSTTQPSSLEPAEKENGISTVTNCSLCQVSYQNVDEQREHARSDHHRYNLKARLRGTKTLTETEFNKAIGELDESISGSDLESESDEDGSEEEDHADPDSTLTALLKKQAKISPSPTEVNQILARTKNGAGKQPLFWFTSPLLEKNTFLGIYRGLFTNVEQEEPDHLVDSLRKKQTPGRVRNSANTSDSGVANEGPHIFMCMIGGGHFAAMIVALTPEIHRKAGGIEERQARVLAHKTFHRYTTRRKQGGAQSANDASKGPAHSAGSSLRRYNEAALENEIRQLLRDWKTMIDDSQLLFVRATGSTNRRILFGAHEGQALRQNDPRLRGFPFTTRRATQAELMRAFTELTRVKISRFDETTLAREAEKQRQLASHSPKPSPKTQKPKMSKEEEEALLHTSQIQALIRRSKVPALLSYISNNAIPPSFTFHPPTLPQNHRAPTPLHLAAASSSPAIVTALLTKTQADPTCVNAEGKTPFDLAGDRATRDAFRVARHELGESAWNWDAAHVPPPISKAEADSRAERESQAANEVEAQRRKEELERLRKEDEARQENEKKKKPAGRTLAPAIEKTFAEKREEEMRGMTPEMRMKLERERRARAAEERIRRMQASSRSQT
ncbi:hypothetical protein VTO42DRAFT_2128 [Malbranchea cinnamomea]